MIRRDLVLLVLTLLVLPQVTEAIPHGGFGVIFPDHNSTRNPAQTARQSGWGAQALWAKFTGSHEQSLVLSGAASLGGFAISAFGNRHGMSLTDSANHEDVLGLAAGWAPSWAPSDLAFGLAFEKNYDVYQTIPRSTTYKVVRASVSRDTADLLKWSLGLQTSLDRPAAQVVSVEIGAGVQLGAWALESVATLATSGGTGSLAAFAKWEGGSFYFAPGVQYLFGAVSAPQALCRAGLIFGSWDLSGFFTYTIKSRENPFHGATLRYGF